MGVLLDYIMLCGAATVLTTGVVTWKLVKADGSRDGDLAIWSAMGWFFLADLAFCSAVMGTIVFLLAR